jgi:hypothetical protein
MNNKVKAAAFVALFTLGIITLSGVIQLALQYLNPTLEQVGVGFAAVMVIYALKMMYDLRLGQLDARDRLKAMSENNPTLR